MGFWKEVGAGFEKHAVPILIGTGIVSSLTAIGLGIGSTPKALRHIEEFKEEECHEKLTFFQTIQACWKDYIWTAISAGVSVTCLVAAASKHNQKIAQCMAAIDICQNGIRNFVEYRKQLANEIGAKKEAEIYNQTLERQVQQNPPPVTMTAPAEGVVEGQQPLPICYDYTFQRYFYATYEMVAAAVVKISQRIVGSPEECASVNDLYYEIPNVSPINDIGNQIGWSQKTGLPKLPEKQYIKYTGTPNGTPCWILSWENPPQYGFQFFRN